MDTFRDVPEFFEVELGESLIARTEILGMLSRPVFIDILSHGLCSATFRELGPPDLCHTVKSQGRGQKDVRLSVRDVDLIVDAT